MISLPTAVSSPLSAFAGVHSTAYLVSTNRRKLVGAILCAFWMVLQSPAQTTKSEEAVVRRAYARLAMATEIGIVEKSYTASVAAYNESREQGSVKYEITSVTGGTLHDVSSTRYATLVSRPDGDVLSIVPGTSTFKEGKTEFAERIASAHWDGGHDMPEEWSNLTVGEVLPHTSLPKATRYANARVIATLAGRSVAYSSLFLFDAAGSVAAIDMVSGSGSVTLFANNAVYPHILLESRSRTRPATRAWITANQLSAACTSNETSECCDLVSLRCGVTPEDVRTSAAKAGEAIQRMDSVSTPTAETGDENQGDCTPYSFQGLIGPGNVAADRSYHLSGNHGMASSFYGLCFYGNPPFGNVCSVYAAVSGGVSMSEYGSRWQPGCHMTGTASVDSYGAAIGAITLPAAIGAGAVQNCLLCNCGVSVSISGPGGSISFPSGTVWTHSAQASWSCPSVNVPSQSPGGGAPDPPIDPDYCWINPNCDIEGGQPIHITPLVTPTVRF